MGPHIATTTITLRARKTRGATIGIVAASNSNSNAADNCEATTGNRQCCSEVFAACAEVKLVGESGPSPSTNSTTPPAPTPTTTAPTSAPHAPAPTATPAPPAVLDGTCVQNPDCSANAWCANEAYVSWCQAHDASKCPTPQCTVKGTSGPSEPEPSTPATPEPEPEPETGGVTCKATPGLNNGVTDSA